MSEETDVDAPELPSWVYLAAGGLTCAGVVGGSVLELLALGIAFLLSVSSVLIGLVGWRSDRPSVSARQWLVTGVVFLFAGSMVMVGLRVSGNIACYRAKWVADAVVDYRRDHGELPENLGALSPEYVRMPYMGGLSTLHTLRLKQQRIQWGMRYVDAAGGDACHPIPNSPLPADIRRGTDEAETPTVDF